MSKQINPKSYQHPVISDEITKSVVSQLNTDISLYDNGGIYKKVEDKFKDLFGLTHVLTCSNGTSALYSMYFGASISHGDEVIVPAYTFFATASPLFLLGAIPVLADCDESGNIDPKSVLEKINDKTKAIVITHMWGIPGKMFELAEIAKEHNILLLEDVSHAHGATYEGKVIGSFSDGAAWSLQGKKLLTAGEGGLFATKHQKFIERAVLLGHFNRRAKLEVRLPEHVDFTTTGLGGNLRMHPLGASVLLPQMHNFPRQLKERREVASFLTQTITKIDGLNNVPVASNVNPAWYAFNFKFDSSTFSVSRERFVDILIEMGGIEFDIPGSTCPLNRYPLFTRPQDVYPEYADFADSFAKGSYPNSDAFHASIIKLPTWHGDKYMQYAEYHMNILKECVARTKKHTFSETEVSRHAIDAHATSAKEGFQKFATGAAIIADSKVLFLKRSADDYMGGLLEMPGGTIEIGEDPVTSLLRETLEETNMNIVRIYGMTSHFDYKSAKGISKRQFTFSVSVKDISSLKLSEEHESFVWLSEDELIKDPAIDSVMKKLGKEALALSKRHLD